MKQELSSLEKARVGKRQKGKKKLIKFSILTPDSASCMSVNRECGHVERFVFNLLKQQRVMRA